MVSNCLPTHPASSREHIDDTGRETGFHSQLGKLQGGQGGHLSWFDDNSIASSKAGGHLPGKHHQRVVPGGDEATHSNWIFSSDGEIPVGWGRVVDWNSASLNLVTPSSKVSPSGDRHANV